MRTNGGQHRPHQRQRQIGGSSPRHGASTSLEARHCRLARSDCRVHRHLIIRRLRWGTLMRHVLLGAPAAGTRRMVHPTAAACLIAPPGGALGMMSSLLRAPGSAVNLAAVAAAADEHLNPAPSAQEQPRRSFHRIGCVPAWTASATGGILPRHACSAPCGARRRTRTWRFRSAPCLPIRQVVIAPLCPHTLRNTAAARAARGRPCGYVDNARALPTSPQAAATTVSAV